MSDKYCAVGFSFRSIEFDCGHIGESYTMKEWIKLIFGDKGLEYFDGFTDGEVKEYIYKNVGYRLTKVRRKGEH